MSSDRDIDDVSDRLRECMDLERMYVHPMFYDLALEIAQLKTKKKGAAAISAFQRERDPPTLSHQDVETIFESDVSAKLIQVIQNLCTTAWVPVAMFLVSMLILRRIFNLSRTAKLGSSSRLSAA